MIPATLLEPSEGFKRTIAPAAGYPLRVMDAGTGRPCLGHSILRTGGPENIHPLPSFGAGQGMEINL